VDSMVLELTSPPPDVEVEIPFTEFEFEKNENEPPLSDRPSGGFSTFQGQGEKNVDILDFFFWWGVGGYYFLFCQQTSKCCCFRHLWLTHLCAQSVKFISAKRQRTKYTRYEVSIL
jgi:hypothetical protein